MARTRAIIEISPALAAELDQLAGPGHRSELASEILTKELKRRRLLAWLGDADSELPNGDYPAWQDSSAWVRTLRQEGEARFDRLREQSNAPLAAGTNLPR